MQIACGYAEYDIEMPEMNGIEATEQALRIRPDLKVIVLSMYGDEQYYYKMVDVGVKGFVLKNSGIEKVIAAIRAVAAGENYFSEELLVNILNNMRDGVIYIHNRKFQQPPHHTYIFRSSWY